MTRLSLVALATGIAAALVTIATVVYASHRRRRSYRETILGTPGLVGYWPLDERSGTVARNLAGTRS